MWAEAVCLVAKFVQSGVSFSCLKNLTVPVHTSGCYCRASHGVFVVVAYLVSYTFSIHLLSPVLAFTKHLFTLLLDCHLRHFFCFI